jgi:hypothetical protein
LGVTADHDVLDHPHFDTFYQRLPSTAADGSDLVALWLVLRAETQDGRRSSAHSELVAAYLDRLQHISVSTDDSSLLFKLALVDRIARIEATNGEWDGVRGASVRMREAVFANHCPVLRSIAAADGFALRGLAKEATDGVPQACLPAMSVDTAQLRADDLSGVNELPTLEEMAVLDRAGQMPLNANLRDALARRASTLLTSADHALASAATLACPSDQIRTAADLYQASGTGRAKPPVPASVAACVARDLRWRGMIADTIAQPSAMSTAVAYLVLQMNAVVGPGETTAVAALRHVDWSAPTLKDMDRLILALTIDPSQITASTIDAAAAAPEAASALGILILNRAAAVVRHCSPTVVHLTDNWLAGITGPTRDSAGGSAVWSIFAAHAGTCQDFLDTRLSVVL